MNGSYVHSSIRIALMNGKFEINSRWSLMYLEMMIEYISRTVFWNLDKYLEN